MKLAMSAIGIPYICPSQVSGIRDMQSHIKTERGIVVDSGH